MVHSLLCILTVKEGESLFLFICAWFSGNINIKPLHLHWSDLKNIILDYSGSQGAAKNSKKKKKKEVTQTVSGNLEQACYCTI